MKEKPQFSYFNEPVRNVIPFKTISLADVYRALTSSYLKERTNQLRLISGKDENRNFKASNFPYVTFSGIFSPTRKNENLKKHSELIALDFDHVENVEELKSQLLKDPYFETELLFVSPNGKGIKWIIAIDITRKYSHGELFLALYNYVDKTYSIEVDPACKDVSRATFLCYDPEAYINPKHLVQ